MTLLRVTRTGPVPVRKLRKIGGVAAALALAAPLSFVGIVPAQAKPATPAANPALGTSVSAFYAARKDYPLWLSPTAGDAADRLVTLLESASLDGLDPARYGTPFLRKAIAAARSGDFRAKQRADHQLSNAFVAYVADVRRDRGIGILWVEPWMKPGVPNSRLLLNDAARAPNLSGYLASMAWMNPTYIGLRNALVQKAYSTPEQAALIRVNMDRARILPVTAPRYILVNAAEQKLFLYEDNRQVDEMRVVVGQKKYPTPMIAAMVRFAALNPYWYVPPDLAWEDVGQFVEKYGQRYFDRMGYQLVSDWTKEPEILDPKTIDWKAVREGKAEVLIRQKPGPDNFMGRMKFMFPNEAGVYLHDNPRRELFEKDVRFFSGGCVRLQDAARLGRWLFGHELVWQDAPPEKQIMLDTPVPVYITYLTAKPDGSGGVAFLDDGYERDEKALAGIADQPVHAVDSAEGVPGAGRP